MSVSEQPDLLFFDTFSHDNSEELNLDLVQFPKSVFVCEVRIIPLGARVQGDFPGGVRLGATNPTQFDIDLFVNDLSKPGACTFESLGRLEYSQNGTIHMQCNATPDKPQIPTDGLVLRGCYTTITLAVYGTLTKAPSDTSAQARPPITQEVATNIPPAREWNTDSNTTYGANEQLEGNYAPDNYDNQIYRGDYYEGGGDAPKDPRTYHQQEWDNAEHEATAHESRHSSRHRDRSREYILKGEYSRSRSHSIDRKRSAEREWDHSPHKKDEYRRRRDDSYERGGSYEPYDARAPSYENKYERRAPSYERKTYGRARETSYGSRSPGDEARKRPRTPPRGTSAGGSPLMSEDAIVEYDRNGKPVTRVDFYQSYRHKSSIRSPSQEPYVEAQQPSVVSVQMVERSPKATEAEPSMDESLEPILSDEEICDDAEGAAYDTEDTDEENDDDGRDVFRRYNPFRCKWHKYNYVHKIYMANGHGKRDGVKDVWSATFAELCRAWPELTKLRDIGKWYRKCEFARMGNGAREEWVQKCEHMCAVVTGMCKETDLAARIFDESKHEGAEFADIHNTLVTFSEVGLELNWALAQHAAVYKIRHMKCGIRLAEALVAHKHSAHVVGALLRRGVNVPLQLMHMYTQPHAALSIRLMILKALSGYVSSRVAVEHLMQPRVYPALDGAGGVSPPRNGYQLLVGIMQCDPLSRIKFAVSCLIKKLNMYELLAKMKETVMRVMRRTEELTESDVELVVEGLAEVARTFCTQSFHMSQPKRFLPASAQFHINRDCSNDAILLYLKEHRFLEVCLYLLTCPTTFNNLVVVSPIHDLIYQLIQSPEGLKFMYDNVKLAGMLFRVLLQPCTEQEMDDTTFGLHMMRHTDMCNYNDLQWLGLQMAHMLRAVHLTEAIADALLPKQTNQGAITDLLLELYTMGYGIVGKVAVPDVLAMDERVECLLEVVERDLRPKGERKVPPAKYECLAKAYAVDLVSATVQMAGGVPFLKKYGHRIEKLVKQQHKIEPSVSGMLHDLAPYLKPLALGGDDIGECVDMIKANLERTTVVPGEMITCLRMLEHHCIAPQHHHQQQHGEQDEYTELKYKYNALQLFSHDGHAHLCNILERLNKHYEQPHMHSDTYATEKGLRIAHMLLPTVRLLDDVVARVVKSRGARFRDLSAAPLLLKTYGLLLAFPTGCAAHRTAVTASAACVRALLAYAQPAADDAAGGDSLKRGPWTSLCGHAIAYATSAPHAFVAGLAALSEMLPLPLPVQCKRAPSERELADALNERRLWSAHLYPLGDELVDMIETMCVSAYRPVVHLLRRLCVQVADLAPATAAIVARAAVGAAVKAVARGTGVDRAVGFLACLVSHAPIKCAVLQGRTHDVLGVLCDVLRAGGGGGGAEGTAAQECASLALVSLCDAEITLTPTTGGEEPEAAVGNSLPSEEALASVLDATAECLGATRSCAVASSVLRVYFVLTEFEFGFRQFRKSLHRKRECYERLLEWLLGCGGEEGMECLGLMLDLVKVLCSEEGEGALGRRGTLAGDELAHMVGYATHKQALHTLEDTLRERGADEHLLSNASFVLSQLRREPVARAPSPCASAVCAAPLVQQFQRRAVHTDNDHMDVERLTSWLTGSTLPDGSVDDDSADDMVLCDLLEIARIELSGCEPGWLQAALRESVGLLPTVMDTIVHRPTVCVPESRVLSVCDTFRSRPPNTSRPPSLHVDDFTARQQAPNYNNRGVRRGVGAGTDRGRFASQTPHHTLYRQMRGRGGWGEMGGPPGQHMGHFPATYNMMAGMAWGGLRMQRPRHRRF